MRTTLTLEADIAKLIDDEVRSTGDTYKATVNRLLRAGLIAVSERRRRTPFTVTPRALGLPSGMSYDNVEEVIEALEGPAHR